MMTTNIWPLVPLSDVAMPVHRPVVVIPGTSYRTLGVKWWGEGAYERQTIDGSQTAARTLNEVREDDLIINKIWVRHGSVAVITSEVAGCAGSNEFPTFEFRLDRILPRWFHWYSKTQELWRKCDALSQGSSGKNRIRPEKFLTIGVPLPPLDEQRCIVAKIERFATRLSDAQRLKKESREGLDHLAVAMAHRTDLPVDARVAAGWQEVSLSEVITTAFDDRKVVSTGTYPNFGIYSYGRGLFPKPPISGMNTSAQRLRKVSAGQFIYSRLFAWEGAFGVVPPEFDGWFVSGEYPTFSCNSERILPEFLLAYFKTPQAWTAVAVGSKGLGSRRQRVQPDQILAQRLWLPPLSWQARIRRVLSRRAELDVQDGTVSKGLDAMLPSILDRAFKGTL